MSKVGFLGLGAMGSRMAANILKAGQAEFHRWLEMPRLRASG
jgi:3-hydroxyisobutyrate dehydrogenase-like beta-hydroxyacid dehydrogenase